ncbi:alcohol dehydrogenase catalytic domain-containing protein [Streptomyces roseirectus]|uniref:Alcohol dehydrogenase catalytic domain-containing protein n=2 Tax=Streptomyces roseirectus TaxID=2768066 RepID=A0A7H0ITQ6_9ACTN|nr:alcohol dehydrogenase catalytic domain-containing protein [Streptomyces roseirectus]
MRAGLLTAPRVLDPHALLDVPEPGPGELLVRVLASGVCGSDLAAWRGTHPYKVAPVVLGHEFCGTVTRLGLQLPYDQGEFAVGDLVCSAAFSPCDGCAECRRGAPHLCADRRNLSHEGWQGSFAEYVLLRRNMTHRLPPGTDPVAGALVEPLSIGLHAVRLAGPGAGRALAVLGSGTIGLSCLLSARRLGFGPAVCVDAGPAKAALAAAAGADGYVDARTGSPSPGEVADLIVRQLAGERPEVVFVAAGYPGVLDQAVAAVRPGGTIVVVSYFDAPVPVDLNALVGREARLLFSSLSVPDDFRRIISWLADGSLDPLPLVTHHFPLERIEEAMAVLDRPAPPGAAPTGKVMLRIGGAA